MDYDVFGTKTFIHKSYYNIRMLLKHDLLCFNKTFFILLGNLQKVLHTFLNDNTYHTVWVSWLYIEFFDISGKGIKLFHFTSSYHELLNVLSGLSRAVTTLLPESEEWTQVLTWWESYPTVTLETVYSERNVEGTGKEYCC